MGPAGHSGETVRCEGGLGGEGGLRCGGCGPCSASSRALRMTRAWRSSYRERERRGVQPRDRRGREGVPRGRWARVVVALTRNATVDAAAMRQAPGHAGRPALLHLASELGRAVDGARVHRHLHEEPCRSAASIPRAHAAARYRSAPCTAATAAAVAGSPAAPRERAQVGGGELFRRIHRMCVANECGGRRLQRAIVGAAHAPSPPRSHGPRASTPSQSPPADAEPDRMPRR
jgi:hypothetical protein